MPTENLPADLEAAHRRIAELSAALDEQSSLVAKLAEEKAKLAEKLEAALHRLKTILREKFGRKSERIAPGQNVLAFPGIMEEFEKVGADAGMVAAFKEELENELKPHPVRQAALDESLPLEEKVHDLPADEKSCDQCGTAMTAIDAEESVQLEFVPATFKRIRHRRMKYGVRPVVHVLTS